MAIVSFIVAVVAALIAGAAVYFVLKGGLRAKTPSASWQEESLVDRFGVLVFRVVYRFLISTIGGALMIALLSKPKSRQNA